MNPAIAVLSLLVVSAHAKRVSPLTPFIGSPKFPVAHGEDYIFANSLSPILQVYKTSTGKFETILNLTTFIPGARYADDMQKSDTLGFFVVVNWVGYPVLWTDLKTVRTFNPDECNPGISRSLVVTPKIAAMQISWFSQISAYTTDAVQWKPLPQVGLVLLFSDPFTGSLGGVQAETGSGSNLYMFDQESGTWGIMGSLPPGYGNSTFSITACGTASRCYLWSGNDPTYNQNFMYSNDLNTWHRSPPPFTGHVSQRYSSCLLGSDMTLVAYNNMLYSYSSNNWDWGKVDLPYVSQITGIACNNSQVMVAGYYWTATGTLQPNGTILFNVVYNGLRDTPGNLFINATQHRFYVNTNSALYDGGHNGTYFTPFHNAITSNLVDIECWRIPKAERPGNSDCRIGNNYTHIIIASGHSFNYYPYGIPSGGLRSLLSVTVYNGRYVANENYHRDFVTRSYITVGDSPLPKDIDRAQGHFVTKYTTSYVTSMQICSNEEVVVFTAGIGTLISTTDFETFNTLPIESMYFVCGRANGKSAAYYNSEVFILSPDGKTITNYTIPDKVVSLAYSFQNDKFTLPTVSGRVYVTSNFTDHRYIECPVNKRESVRDSVVLINGTLATVLMTTELNLYSCTGEITL